MTHYGKRSTNLSQRGNLLKVMTAVTSVKAGVTRSTSAKTEAPKRVQVYWNLNKAKQGEYVFSVRHRGKVIAYSGFIYLRNCKFHVNPDHSSRIKGGHKRSVHAWVTGDLVPKGGVLQGSGPVELSPVTYNPHRDSSFVDCESGQVVQEANLVALVAEVSAEGGKGRVYYV